MKTQNATRDCLGSGQRRNHCHRRRQMICERCGYRLRPYARFGPNQWYECARCGTHSAYEEPLDGPGFIWLGRERPIEGADLPIVGQVKTCPVTGQQVAMVAKPVPVMRRTRARVKQ